jgi:hypothetical protein
MMWDIRSTGQKNVEQVALAALLCTLLVAVWFGVRMVRGKRKGTRLENGRSSFAFAVAITAGLWLLTFAGVWLYPYLYPR